MDRNGNMTKKMKEIWFDGRSIPVERIDIWSYINNSPINKVLVTVDQLKKGHYPLKTEFIVQVGEERDLEDIQSGSVAMSEKADLLKAARQHGLKTCICFHVQSKEELENAWQEGSRFDYVLVDFDLPTNIPLELIIARLQQSPTILLKQVRSFDEAEVVFGVMERGSDGVLLSTAELSEIVKTVSFLEKESMQKIKLQPLTVSEIAHIGMGMRACIDTTGIMTQEEGMIIGSTSTGGIFVCSETHYLPYMNLRPFRVNAGAVHSYVWMPNNTAEYLSDLKAGSKVLSVNIKGDARTLTVGRVKIEKRPLMLIRGEAAGKEINVIVQDEWHIRVMGADGNPKNATMVQPGDKLLAMVCEPGRHVGIKIDETIIEK